MNKNITPLPWSVTGADGSRIYGGNTFIASTWLPRKPNEERMEGESWLEMRERTRPERDAIDSELRANAAYIVEACNAYPALTARVKELEEENARLEAEVTALEFPLESPNGTRYCRACGNSAKWGHEDDCQIVQDINAALNKEPT